MTLRRAWWAAAWCFVLVSSLPALAWNVMDEGAKGDGETDDTAAFQQALDKAGAAGGGIVDAPAGHYRISGHLSVPGSVTLQGTFRVPPTNRHDAQPKLEGTVLLAYEGRGTREGEPFIRLAGSMATVAGIIVSYPEWKQSDVPPIPYPPTVLAEHNDNAGVLDCCFINPYEALRFTGAGRFLVRNVYGYPSFRGLYVDACYDIARVENCHFWPFGVVYTHDDPFCQWVNVNGVAFEFARTDWQYVLNTFCFGYGVGYKFSASENGPCNGNFLGLGADSCRRAVLVEQCQPPGLLITNGEFVGRWGSEDSVCVEIGSDVEGKVSLTNCAFWGPIDRCIWQQGDKAQTTAMACNFVSWDNNGKGAPAIQIDAGRAIIQGNTFAAGKAHVLVNEPVQSALILGNQAPGGLAVHNGAGNRTQTGFNEVSLVEWTPEAKLHYRVDVGRPGDDAYLERWYGSEKAGEWEDGGSKRWSTGESTLTLPVLKGRAYKITLDVYVPTYASAPENGLFLADARIVDLSQNEQTVSVSGVVPPSESEEVVLSLRVKGWIPAEVVEGSTDRRMLGIALRSIEMTAMENGGQVFDAGTGMWKDMGGGEAGL